MAKKTDRFHEFARLGAQVRLRELQEEVRAIYKAFPGLRFAKRAPAATDTGDDSDATVAARSGRKRRKLTAAEKKSISDRMKKYWAKRKSE